MTTSRPSMDAAPDSYALAPRDGIGEGEVCTKAAGFAGGWRGPWRIASASLLLALGGLVGSAGDLLGAAAPKEPPEPVAWAILTPRVVREVRELLSLSPQELKVGLPVEITGVVTLFDEEFSLFFIHDGTGCAYVYAPGPIGPYEPGQRLQIKGVAQRGQFAPIIAQPQIRADGTAPLPEPLCARDADLVSGALDSQWAEADGIVRTQRLTKGRLRLDMVSGRTRFGVWVQHLSTNKVPDFVDSRIRVRGMVSAKLDAARHLTGFELFVSSITNVQKLTPAAGAPGSATSFLTKDFTAYAMRRQAGHRVQVQGCVAVCWSSRGLLLTDPTGTFEVQCATNVAVSPGDVLDVTGFLAPRPCSPKIEEAIVKKVGARALDPPVFLGAGVPLQAAQQNHCVRLEAVLLARTQPEPDVVELLLRSDHRVLRAFLWSNGAEEELTDLQPGSRLRVAGVCRLSPRNTPDDSLESPCPWCDGACRLGAKEQAESMHVRLWLRSPADVTVVSSPITGWTLWCLASLGVCVTALAAVMLSRRRRLQVERLMGEQLTLQAEIRENERQLRRSVEEREQISRDLHDDVIQSIYAVGLGLEEARRHVRQAPDRAEARLGTAVEALNDVLRKVRSFLGGLQSRTLDGREFKTALKSLALTTGENQAQFAIEVDAEAANSLTSTEAAQLLFIAKEAMSNSLRHAQSSRIIVTLNRANQELRLEIGDDGIGFDPVHPAHEGCGLRNMASRATSVGGRLEILSTPGSGCRIIVHLPKPNNHADH